MRKKNSLRKSRRKPQGVGVGVNYTPSPTAHQNNGLTLVSSAHTDDYVTTGSDSTIAFKAPRTAMVATILADWRFLVAVGLSAFLGILSGVTVFLWAGGN